MFKINRVLQFIRAAHRDRTSRYRRYRLTVTVPVPLRLSSTKKTDGRRTVVNRPFPSWKQPLTAMYGNRREPWSNLIFCDTSILMVHILFLLQCFSSLMRLCEIISCAWRTLFLGYFLTWNEHFPWWLFILMLSPCLSLSNIPFYTFLLL